MTTGRSFLPYKLFLLRLKCVELEFFEVFLTVVFFKEIFFLAGG